MAEIQVTRWRDLPSLVVAREGESVVKVPLSSRLQEAIDEAAMRLGAIDSTAYLEGWGRGDWEDVEGEPADVARELAETLEAQWSDAALRDYLDAIGPAMS